MSQATPVDILVMGAGSIGCFVGGKLASQRLRGRVESLSR